MERDLYVKMKARQDVVNAWLNKLDNVKTDDVGLIPALVRYIEDGDDSAFEDYKNWHFVKTIEEKKNILEEAQKETKRVDDEIQTIKSTYEAKKEDYCKYFVEALRWKKEREKLLFDSSKFTSQTYASLLKKIEGFHPEAKRSSIWVRVGDNTICVHDAEIVPTGKSTPYRVTLIADDKQEFKMPPMPVEPVSDEDEWGYRESLVFKNHFFRKVLKDKYKTELR